MPRRMSYLAGLIALAVFMFGAGPQFVHASGSGLNTVVVVNRASSNSLALGNFYAERRGVPPQNVVPIEWNGGKVQWTRQEFQDYLAVPLATNLVARGLTNQVDFAALSLDIPYRVIESNGVNSTTTALFYGFRADGTASGGLPDSCSLPASSVNSYALSEELFRTAGTARAPTNVMAFMLAGNSLEEARRLIDRGVASDGTFPTNPVILAKTSDLVRSRRHVLFDNAIVEARILGAAQLMRVDTSSTTFAGLLGLSTGTEYLDIAPNTFVPGALADHLTSFGGYLYDPTYQTNILALLSGGAVASHGTIVEPCAYTEKFPDPMIYYLQSRGFNAAECYYQGIRNPHQSLLVGEPLAAPFARAGTGRIISPWPDTALSGVASLEIDFQAADVTRPIQTIELYASGTRLSVLTNILADRANPITININGHAMTYTSSTNATSRGLARGITAMLSSTVNQTATRTTATIHGDRVELRFTNFATSGSSVPVSMSTSVGAPMNVSLRAALPQFLDSPALARRQFNVQGPPSVNAIALLNVTKTNGTSVAVGFTNNGANLSGFMAAFAAVINVAPGLSGPDGVVCEDILINGTTAGSFGLRARSSGRGPSGITVGFSSSGSIAFSPGAAVKLDENLTDLLPRNHLYFAVGATNVAGKFSFDTRALPDGYHDLTVVGIEGSHVRTQTRASVPVRIRNHTLEAILRQTAGGSPASPAATLQFTVTANSPTMASVELHGTGGLLAAASEDPSPIFSVPAAQLGVGRHRFHALVTNANGERYRTAPIVLEISADLTKTPFPVVIATDPVTLTWTAVMGRRYVVLATSDLRQAFTPVATVTPTGNNGAWTDPAPGGARRFYRVQLEP